MTFKQILRSINHNFFVHFCLLVFLGLCVLCHLSATFKIDMSGGHFTLMNERTVKSLALIQFIGTNLWFPVLYGLVTFGGVFYLQVRGHPRWAYWLYAAVLCLPFWFYMSACAYIGGKFIF